MFLMWIVLYKKYVKKNDNVEVINKNCISDFGEVRHILTDKTGTLTQNKMTVKDGEGFVLNIDGHKIKLKCEDYLQLHRLDDKLSSPNVLIQAYAKGTIDDLYANMTPLMKKKE